MLMLKENHRSGGKDLQEHLYIHGSIQSIYVGKGILTPVSHVPTFLLESTSVECMIPHQEGYTWPLT